MAKKCVLGCHHSIDCPPEFVKSKTYQRSKNQQIYHKTLKYRYQVQTSCYQSTKQLTKLVKVYFRCYQAAERRGERRGGRRRRGRRWGTRRYHWARLCTLHFPLRKRDCWAKQTHSVAPGPGEDIAEEQPASSRNIQHVKGDVPTDWAAARTHM